MASGLSIQKPQDIPSSIAIPVVDRRSQFSRGSQLALVFSLQPVPAQAPLLSLKYRSPARPRAPGRHVRGVFAAQRAGNRQSQPASFRRDAPGKLGYTWTIDGSANGKERDSLKEAVHTCIWLATDLLRTEQSFQSMVEVACEALPQWNLKGHLYLPHSLLRPARQGIRHHRPAIRTHRPRVFQTSPHKRRREV
jgi:hypothetical protein